MELTTSMKCIKYLLFAFNLIVFIIGLVFIIGGAVLMTAFSEYFAFFGNDVNSASLFIIIIGVVCLVVSFFGCFGAIRENHCMIVTFSVFLSVVLLLEIAAVVSTFILRSHVEKLARDQMKQTIPNYSNVGVGEAWDHLQSKLECCGVESYVDWKKNDEFKSNYTVPESCCINATTPKCADDVLRNNITTNIHVDGCGDKFIAWSDSNIALLGGITIFFAVIQLIGIVLACVLAGALRKQYQPV